LPPGGLRLQGGRAPGTACFFFHWINAEKRPSNGAIPAGPFLSRKFFFCGPQRWFGGSKHLEFGNGAIKCLRAAKNYSSRGRPPGRGPQNFSSRGGPRDHIFSWGAGRATRESHGIPGTGVGLQQRLFLPCIFSGWDMAGGPQGHLFDGGGRTASNAARFAGPYCAGRGGGGANLNFLKCWKVGFLGP